MGESRTAADASVTVDGGPGSRESLERVCRWVAYVGGAGLVATMAVVVSSVVGAQFGAPILGDTEMVDLTTGVLVFCFLPWCHLHGGNVIVDFFTRPLPRRVNDALDAIMNFAFAVVAGVLTWRLIAGGLSAYQHDRRSMFLALPDWWVYSIGGAVSILWVAVIMFVGWECLQRARGRLAGPAAADMSQFD